MSMIDFSSFSLNLGPILLLLGLSSIFLPSVINALTQGALVCLSAFLSVCRPSVSLPDCVYRACICHLMRASLRHARQETISGCSKPLCVPADARTRTARTAGRCVVAA